jgi:hypothetical protein
MKDRRLCYLGMAMVFAMGLMGSVCAEKPSELMEIAEFASADPEARLAWINQKLESKEFTSRNISGDVMTRFILDVLVKENSAEAQMKKYGEIRKAYDKLVSTYDLEKYLAMKYLAEVPEAKAADVKGKAKIIHQLHKQDVLSWPGIADVLKGMLAVHLATSEEFQAMTPLQQVEYLAAMDGQNIVGNLTSASFTKGVAAEWMSNTPADEQEGVFNQINGAADFFTRTTIRSGYQD